MDYKITCVCGHQFLLPEDKLRGDVFCPACHQRLNPAIETAATATAPAAADPAVTNSASAPIPAPTEPDPEPTKRCPFCGEVILAIARKCKHCGEFLDRAPPAAAAPSDAPAPTLTPGAPTAAATPAALPNDPVFSLTISQWDNFWKYLTILTLFAAFTAALLYIKPLRVFAPFGIPGALVLAAIVAWFFYLHAKRTRVVIRPLRIDIEKGLLGKNITSLDLFRITDITLQQGIIPRILGFGTIKLTTTDTDSPELFLRQIPRAREVRQYLQTQIPLAARQRGALYMEK